MNRRTHATLARMLIAACGGLEEAAGVCRIGRSQLSDCQSPHGAGFLPADVIADLEAHCGEPVVSRALARAVIAEAPEAGEALVDAACEAAEAVAALQREVRRALSDGALTPGERTALTREFHAAMRGLGDVGAALERGESDGG